MARLNEPPIAPSGVAIASAIAPGAESVEAPNLEEVKRRFIRQNRELAKANSTQSLRIRSLEIENSRLLDETLRLRERNLWLERERQNAQINLPSEAIRRLKDELHAKFAELTDFVAGLAERGNDLPTEDYLLPKEKLLSPSTRQYRERQPLAELMQECIMPTISEDRISPQRTLNAEAIRAIRISDHGSSESPDLGPPPVARFDCGSSIPAASPAVEHEIMSTETPIVEGEEHGLTNNMSVNLETRRKKKDGSSRLEIRRHSVMPQSFEQSEQDSGTTILRTGAKRKLADRDPEKQIKPPSADEFTFSRKPTGSSRPTPTSELGSVQDGIAANGLSDRNTVQGPAKPARRVLGNRSTNISPQKPQSKLAQSEKGGLEKTAPPKLNISRQRAQPRTRRASSVSLSSTADETPAIVDVLPALVPATESITELPPKTPATADLLSPGTLDDSINKPLERGDTPPPADLSSISNTTDGGQRPSRRARSAVNYAEPSLISKMRRPGKEMVDAISGIQDPRRTMNAPESRRSQGVTPSSQPTDTKPDGNDCGASWNHMHSLQGIPSQDLDPGSPLRSRTTMNATTLAASSIPLPEIMTTIKSETEGSGPSSPYASTVTSGSSTAISKLIATSRKRRESAVNNSVSFNIAPQTVEDASAAARRMEEMNLYEFKESSSPAPERAEDRRKSGAPATGGATAKLGSQRRHSSIVKDVPTDVTANSGVGARSERAASRRRSTLL